MTKRVRKTPRAKRFWRYKDGALPNSLAMAYASFGHIAALYLISAEIVFLNLIGVLLTASTLVVAAYLIHELAHALVFYKKQHNQWFGEFFSWICGSAYASFERIQYMHMRHHADRADITCFDYRDTIKIHPLLRKCIFVLEWAHIPAVELIMHYQVLLRPFKDEKLRGQRPRVVITLISRIAFFATLYLANPLAILFYALAYLIFIKLLYLGDAFAHTYEGYAVQSAHDPVPKGERDAHYDKLNTYSNIVSKRWPWLNLYNLNFGFHNAHHDKPAAPWYKLPEVQQSLYEETSPQYLPYKDVMRSFHKNRLDCILPTHELGPDQTGKHRADHFLGVHGVSFLSII